jgi:hypothetical protein
VSFSLDEICRREYEGVVDREPTARELFAFKRHYDREGMCGTDHEPYAECMAWDRWGGTDWSSGGVTGRPVRRRPPTMYERVVFQHAVTRAETVYPEIVDRVREKLSGQATVWCDGHGYLPGDASWETIPQEKFETVTFRLTVEVTPRTDGEWAAIRQAIAEDEADRKEATAAKTSVDDRLDALAASVAVWSARTPTDVREALREPLKGSTADV